MADEGARTERRIVFHLGESCLGALCLGESCLGESWFDSSCTWEVENLRRPVERNADAAGRGRQTNSQRRHFKRPHHSAHLSQDASRYTSLLNGFLQKKRHTVIAGIGGVQQIILIAAN